MAHFSCFTLRARLWRLAKLVSVLLLISMCALHAKDFYQQKGYVNDYTNSMDPKTVSFLNKQLQSLEKEDGIVLVVAVVQTLQGAPIQDAAQDFFSRWQIGHTSRDSGILLVLALAEKKVYIELGYGIPEPITEVDAERICREIIGPLLQKNKIDSAVQAGVAAIFDTLGKAFGKEGVKTVRTVYTTQFMAVFLVSLVLLYLVARFAPSRYFFLSPTIGFFAGLTQSFGLAIVLAFLGIIMVLICYMLKTYLPEPLKKRRK